MKDGSCLVKGRQFLCGVFPIGIDTAKFESLAKLATRDGDLQEVYKKTAGCDVAIGVDRLDYSKGIDQRIVAFRHFLDRNSHRVRKTLLLQITPKSRGEIPAYLALQKHIAELVGSVNGELGTIDWVPVHYTNRSHGPLEPAGLYRMARVGLVTPLRDGMNLVAKEYVAAQDPSNPGSSCSRNLPAPLASWRERCSSIPMTQRLWRPPRKRHFACHQRNGKTVGAQ